MTACRSAGNLSNQLLLIIAAPAISPTAIEQATFSAAAVQSADRTPTVLRAPADAVRPLGWSGSRIVWLTGATGSQRLVLADEESHHVETWMRFDVGAVPVEDVTWSTDLTGRVRR